MRIKPCSLQGVYEILLDPHLDHRGHFTRIYDQQILKYHGLDRHWVQENRSYSMAKGTVRGLHFQAAPYAETKLIRVTKGAIYDVFVDVRKDSPTLGCWDSVLLTEDNHKMLYIPKGFAHGLCTLTDDCEVVYKVDNLYSPSHERGIVWNDSTLQITWPILRPILSSKDRALPAFDEYMKEEQR